MSHTSAAARRSFNAVPLDEEHQFIEDLRGMIWKDGLGRARSWKQLAENAGVNAATVSKFASGETKRPQFLTIRRLAHACGYRLAFLPANVRAAGEVRVESFRTAKRR